MMGTLAAVLAKRQISTPKDKFRAEVNGDIENVNGVLKITRIHVQYFLKLENGEKEKVLETMNEYLPLCPGAQSVLGCIKISHEMIFE